MARQHVSADADSGTVVDYSRRRVLQGAAGLTLAAAARPAVAQSSTPDYGSWFDNVGNYNGKTVDKTGQSEVRITVGAKGNGGAFAFDPPAVKVDTGTTVVWEWSGNGGSHNVVAENGAFKSKLTDKSGHTFEYTVEETGIIKYACSPHKAMGMRGALVVAGGGGETSQAGGSESTTTNGGASGKSSGPAGPTISPSAGAVGVSMLLAFLSPLGLAALLRREGDDRQTGTRPRTDD